MGLICDFSGSIGIFSEFLEVLDFVSIKFRDLSRIAKLAKLKTLEIKWK